MRTDTRDLLRKKRQTYLQHVHRFERYAAELDLFEPHVHDVLERNGMATNMLRDLDVHTAGYYWTRSSSGRWIGKLGEKARRVHPALETRLDFVAEHGDDDDVMESFRDDDDSAALSTFLFSVESTKRKHGPARGRQRYMWERRVYVNEEVGPFPLDRATVKQLARVLAQEHQHLLQDKEAYSVTPDGLVLAPMNDAWAQVLVSMEAPWQDHTPDIASAWKPHIARGVLPPLFPPMTYFVEGTLEEALEGTKNLEMPHIPIILSEDFVDVHRPLRSYPGPWSIKRRSQRKRKHRPSPHTAAGSR